MSKERPTVVIAGASGFIGRHLARALQKDFRIIGLSRKAKGEGSPGSGIDEWRTCDLLSLSDAERALRGATFAYYLVHSMMPAARLSQGAFWDFDLIAADNFARAAKKAGIKQILYVSGFVPRAEKLSRHLSSRREVEQVLGAYDVPLTSLRAGLVIGPEGSSFQISVRLVQKLPILFFPQWAENITHPIALEDIIRLLVFALNNPDTYGQIYDVGGPEVTSYRSLLVHTAKALGLKRRSFRIPFSNLRVIQWFVSWISGAPGALVRPLLESLEHPTIAKERLLNEMADLPGTHLIQAVQDSAHAIQNADPNAVRPVAFEKRRFRGGRPTVRSAQRYPLPPGKTAEWVAREYMTWLPHWFKLLLNLEVKNEVYKISLRFLKSHPLLVLMHVPDRSWPDRQLFFIKGGLLARDSGRGRLEFRESLGGTVVIVALHEFTPSLPWFIYTLTQAKLHLIVMRSFYRHIEHVRDELLKVRSNAKPQTN